MGFEAAGLHESRGSQLYCYACSAGCTAGDTTHTIGPVMHRATPLNSSFRAYVAGGARATIPEVDDSKYMQASKGNFMSNEARSAIEAPQNYGFTSVAADATKDAQGKILQC